MKFHPIFFTSDWHIGHQNSIIFDERPFKNLDHMHRVLINNYNSTVPENGVCYFLGDMGMCGSGELAKVISQLNGTKILVLGNHDKGVNAMYNSGFDAVLHGAVTYIADERVSMSHCPLRGVWREDTTNMRGSDPENLENWHGETRKKHSKLTFNDEGQFHLHGHIHSHPDRKEKSTKTLGKQYDVGVPANNYTPVSYGTLAAWIAEYKRRNG